MGLREGNEFTNNVYVILSALIGYVVFEFVTISVQIFDRNLLLCSFICMIQLLLAVLVNLLFGKLGFTVSVVTSLLKVGLFTYDYVFYPQEESLSFAPIMIIFAIATIIINLAIQFFLDTVYARMFRVKNLYNSTRERLVKMATEKNAKTLPSTSNDTKLIAKHNEEVALRNEMTSVTTNLDSLTTLPNRAKIVSYLEDWIDDATSMLQSGGGINKSTSCSVHVIYIAITNFERLLHYVGHRRSDLFIQVVAHRIRDIAHTNDIVGRVEASEFIIISKRNLSKEDLISYSNQISNVINDSFKNNDAEITVASSIGLASFPEDARFSGELINRAEYAVSIGASNTAGLKNSIKTFREANEETHRFVITNNSSDEKFKQLFLKALDNKEISVVYQPQYDKNSTLIGFEAFLRWTSPELGIVNAADFLALAEQTGLIYKLGQYSIETSLKFLSKLNLINKKLKLSINFSAFELKFGNTPGELADLISRYNINPSNIIVDIPEECLLSSFETVKPALGYISSLGVLMTLDNFGRSYSSLNSIPLLPISAIKIDGNFTRNINEKDTTQVIVSSIITLMHEIDINVCATGVGSEEQKTQLLKYGCDFFQGRVYSNPLTEEEVLKMIM